MTTSPPETLDDFSTAAAQALGGEVVPAKDTIKISVASGNWVAAATAARDELGLVFFSWLSAVDWSNAPVLGEPVAGEVEERFEVLCTLSNVTDGKRVTLSTNLAKGEPKIASLVSVYAGADWHERETHEMFGIVFEGHPNLENLYLPDGFIGQPLLKSYPLMSREVKPWPGTVDVEGMPGADDEEEPAEAEE